MGGSMNESIIGHTLLGNKVLAVHLAEDGRQYIKIPEEDDEPLYGNYLMPGQTWDSPAFPPLQGSQRVQAEPLAYHEAGHAVACIDEGLAFTDAAQCYLPIR
jgi:hypothetical protein